MYVLNYDYDYNILNYDYDYDILNYDYDTRNSICDKIFETDRVEAS